MDHLADLGIENVAGLVSFKFAPLHHIISIAEPVGHEIGSITWDAGKDWLNGYALPQSLSSAEEANETNHGMLYNCVLTATIPNDTKELVAQLNEMKPYRFVIAFQDRNGNIKLFGSLESPCKFSFQLVKTNDANHYQIKFTCIHLVDPPYFLDAGEY